MTRRERMLLKSLVIRAIILFFVICIPVWCIKACNDTQKTARKDGEKKEEKVAAGDDRQIMLNDDGKVKSVSLEEYILGVVSAEMPASFEEEALKAQAVAARTYTVKKLEGGGCSRGGDICTDSGHCQAYKSQAQRKSNWKSNYEQYEAKLGDAVSQTRGLIVTYDGEPIEALFHSTAGGMTEDSQNAFTTALPYLKSVPSDETDAPRYLSEVFFSRSDVSKKLNKKGGRTSPSKLQAQFEVTSRYPSGRVDRVVAGGKELTGREMRSLFDLPSTNFEVTFYDDGVKFETKGYGHGVGLSQTGADAMAKKGETFESILTYYYTGTSVEPL